MKELNMDELPDPSGADEQGVVFWTHPSAVRPVLLQHAYRRGMFPWPFSPRHMVPWASPDPRAILDFARLHVPRSLRRASHRRPWEFTIDRAFPEVIAACAAARRPGGEGTWIIPVMRRAYTELHRAGGAHSVEVWLEGRLVGGMYGVDCGGVFTGESMFRTEPDASKLALLHLVGHLRERGSGWIDIQQLTPHLAALGAHEVTRAVFLERLRSDLDAGIRLF